MGYWHDKSGDTKTNTFSIAPEAGYDFNKHWSVGAALGFDLGSVKVGDADSKSANVFTIAPYARYKYYQTGILTLFMDGGFGIATGDSDGFQVGLTPGLALSITDHFSFLTSVGFLGYKKDYYNGGNGSGFGLRLASSDLKFGFYYSF